MLRGKVSNEISAYMSATKCNHVVEKVVRETTEGKIHLWGLQNGTTIKIKAVGKAYIDWEVINEPIGIVDRQINRS